MLARLGILVGLIVPAGYQKVWRPYRLVLSADPATACEGCGPVKTTKDGWVLDGWRVIKERDGNNRERRGKHWATMQEESPKAL
jgi:hypothetical protein